MIGDTSENEGVSLSRKKKKNLCLYPALEIG